MTALADLLSLELDAPAFAEGAFCVAVWRFDKFVAAADVLVVAAKLLLVFIAILALGAFGDG